jgi:plasmid stabilization system protein ParE
MEIEWSYRARTDLQDLHTYISKDSPYYAKQFVERIFVAVEKLQVHPKIGRLVPEANREDVRELLFHHYRIMYLLQPDKIFIVTVVHGSRDLSQKESPPWNIL